MLKNFLKITWRNIVRQKGNSFINIAGLAIGMTCSMLILLWVQDELSYDRYHKNADDIYRVVENQYYAGGQLFPVAVTPAPLASAMKNQFPEIIKSTRVAFTGRTIKYGEHIFNEEINLVDPDFLEIFTVPFLKGDPQTALSDPHSIVLTKEMAEKYFGDEDPMGKVLKINQNDFVVSGVVKNVPKNSHFRYDFLIPFVYLQELGVALDNWGRNAYYTYVMLDPNASYRDIDAKIIDFIQKNNKDSSTEIYLQPLTQIHLYSAGKYTADIGGHGDIRYVRIFAVIAFFVLLIACINFMNLATARSERRAKEVGLRKVVGAQRHQIIKQFFGESIFLSFFAFCFALLFSELLLPVFNNLSGKNLSLNHLDIKILLGFLGIALVAGLISGSYPALYLSSFRPIETLKASKGSVRSGSSLFRQILVVVQFTLSVVMIIGAIVVSRQIDYIRNKKLGLDKENLAYVYMDGEFKEKYEVAKQELLKNPNITDITATSQLPTYVASSTDGWGWEGKDPEDDILMHYVMVDQDYVKTFKMEMAEGRFFSSQFATDSLAAVVNEAALKVMGMQSPIGQRLSIDSDNLHIIGVVKNFHFKPIRTKIEPLVLLLAPRRYNVMVLRIRPENVEATIAYIESVYKKFNAETPFTLNFLDESYDKMYKTERRIGEISGYFALMAILISSLGLYGLTAFMAEQRTQEIGIRKVLGASIPDIFMLLSKNFVMLTALANCIAWPIAYVIMRNWLQNYAYHASLNITIFIAAAILALIIVLITVSYQGIKASLANPVDALRYE